MCSLNRMPYVLCSDPVQTRKTEAAIRKIRSLLPGTNVTRAIVFGSAASASVTRGSDLDLLLVRPTRERFVDRAADLYRLFDCDLALDLLVYTPEEFERLKIESPLVRHAVATGEAIYEADPRE